MLLFLGAGAAGCAERSADRAAGRPSPATGPLRRPGAVGPGLVPHLPPRRLGYGPGAAGRGLGRRGAASRGGGGARPRCQRAPRPELRAGRASPARGSHPPRTSSPPPHTHPAAAAALHGPVGAAGCFPSDRAAIAGPALRLNPWRGGARNETERAEGKRGAAAAPQGEGKPLRAGSRGGGRGGRAPALRRGGGGGRAGKAPGSTESAPRRTAPASRGREGRRGSPRLPALPPAPPPPEGPALPPGGRGGGGRGRVCLGRTKADFGPRFISP